MLSRICFLFAILLGHTFAATTYYVTQAGAGSANGSTLGNAWSVANFNTSGNWSATPGTAGKISPGDTVSLNGTLTSALTVQQSGSAGNIITLLFASGSKFSVAAVPNSGAIIVNQKDYITIDGGSTGTIGGPGATGTPNGIIESTDNGTNLGNHVDSIAIFGVSANYLTVQGLTIRNLYVRVAGGEQNPYGTAVQNPSSGTVKGHTGYTVTNNIINNCYIAEQCNYGTDGVTNMTVSYNTITHCNWGGYAGDAASGATLSGLLFHHNIVSDFDNWDDPLNNSFHHNGSYFFAENGGTARNVQQYNNILGPSWGTYSTGGMFMSGDCAGIKIYNNISLGNAGDAPTNGFSASLVIHSGSGSGYQIYNNTVVGGGVGKAFFIQSGNGSGVTTFDCQNNLAVNVETAFAIYNNTTLTLTANYNLGYNLGSGKEYSYSNDGSAGYLSFSGWQSAGFDANGSNGNPNLNGSYVPVAVSAAIGAGANLSGTFTTDFNGATRTVPWDMGAVKAAGGSTGGSLISGKVSLAGKVSVK